MRGSWVVVVAVVSALASAGSGTGQVPAGDTLSVSAVRFFQPASGGTTVEVLAELQLGAVVHATGPFSRYRVTAEVRDSAGVILAQSGWDREIAAGVLRMAGATAVEGFRFAAAPGRYAIRMQAASPGGTTVSRDIEVRAYAVRPPISDLLLATAVRQAASDSDAATPGEVRRAGLAMSGAPIPRLSLDRATMSYYAEVYPWQGVRTDGEMWVEVNDTSGRRLVNTPRRAVQFAAEGGVARGSVDLTGLPTGGYAFRVLIRLGDSTIVAQAAFSVAAPTAAVMTASAAPTPADRFDGVAEAVLDSLQAPLMYLAEDRERGVYGNLSVEGKRRFLREFWRRRDPSPGTPDNAAEEEFYRVLAFVNESFRERGAAQTPGWRTDRGRVYLRNGRPDEVLRRPAALPRPYEAWKYTRGRSRFHVFVDQSGVGHYILMGTNDRAESTMPGWEDYLGPDGARDVAEFIR